MPNITELHHVSLIVADTERSLGFYRDLLGLSVDSARPDLGYPGAWLNVGGRQIHLLQVPDPNPAAKPAAAPRFRFPRRERVGAMSRRKPRPVFVHGGRDRHFAMLVADLSKVIADLEAAGLDYTLSRSGRRALFCRDPDGNAVELIQSGRADEFTHRK